MIVCSCRLVNDSTIRSVIAGGAATVREITDRCRAASGCGGCKPTLQRLLDERHAPAGHAHGRPAFEHGRPVSEHGRPAFERLAAAS